MGVWRRVGLSLVCIYLYNFRRLDNQREVEWQLAYIILNTNEYWAREGRGTNQCRFLCKIRTSLSSRAITCAFYNTALNFFRKLLWLILNCALRWVDQYRHLTGTGLANNSMLSNESLEYLILKSRFTDRTKSDSLIHSVDDSHTLVCCNSNRLRSHTPREDLMAWASTAGQHMINDPINSGLHPILSEAAMTARLPCADPVTDNKQLPSRVVYSPANAQCSPYDGRFLSPIAIMAYVRISVLYDQGGRFAVFLTKRTRHIVGNVARIGARYAWGFGRNAPRVRFVLRENQRPLQFCSTSESSSASRQPSGDNSPTATWYLSGELR